MGGQHQRVDRPGLLRDTKGVIGGAPTTLRVKGLMMMDESIEGTVCSIPLGVIS